MGRLIPLRLPSLSNIKEETLVFVSSYPSPLSTKSTRLATDDGPLIPPTPRERPGPVTDLVIFPEDVEEWAIVMEEVKILYRKRQYKQCSARCTQILENIKDPVSIFSPD